MRIREYQIGMRHLHVLFSGGDLDKHVIAERLYYPDIPADAKLHHIEVSRGGMFWSVYIEHPSFEEVPDFCLPKMELMKMVGYPILHVDGQNDMVLLGKTREQLVAIRDAIDKLIGDTPRIVVVEVTPTESWSTEPKIHNG